VSDTDNFDDCQLIPIKEFPIEAVRKLAKNYFPVGFFDDYKITKKQGEELAKFLTKAKRGVQVYGALLCAGPKCRYASKCKLQKWGKAPLGADCPIELMLIDMWIADYCEALDISLHELDLPSNKLDRTLIVDLVLCDIKIMRLEAELSLHSFEMTKYIKSGRDVVETVEPSIALSALEKAHSRKDKLLKQLMGTREARAKAQAEASKSMKDVAQYMSDLVAKAEKAQKSIEIDNAEYTEVDSEDILIAGG